MKKLLSAIFIFCASQTLLLHGYENLNRFYSDDFPVKDICNNNPKALIFWKGSIEKACDCLDNGLGKPKKIVRAIERFKQDQDKQQLFNAFMIKELDKINEDDAFQSEEEAIDTILSDQDTNVKKAAKQAYIEAFIKAFNDVLVDVKQELDVTLEDTVFDEEQELESALGTE